MKNIYRDDINKLANQLTDDIVKHILLSSDTAPDMDGIYDILCDQLDRFCGFPDYRNYN